MPNFKSLLWVLVGAVAMAAPVAKMPPPPLAPGEALVLAGPDGVVHAFGPSTEEELLGTLASLPWLKLEGAEWSSEGLTFKCGGALNGFRCSDPKGHGRVVPCMIQRARHNTSARPITSIVRWQGKRKRYLERSQVRLPL